MDWVVESSEARLGTRPARACKSRASRWLHGNKWLYAQGDPGWGLHPERFNPDRVERALRWCARWFEGRGFYPVHAEGFEHIPDSPAMLVSNHSGGSTVLDCMGLAYAWYRHFSAQRPLHFMAHEILLSTRLTGPFFDEIGVLRTSRCLAHEVLTERARDMIVMPGGDRDTWRPWRERHRVRFSGHVGYARMAIQTGVPVVPLAHAGPHDTLMVLTDGARIARRLRLHDLFRIDVFPIHVSLPWGVGIGPWPHLPFPTTLRYRIGAPIPLPCARDPDPPLELVQRYDRQVRAALQALLDALASSSPESPPKDAPSNLTRAHARPRSPLRERGHCELREA